MKKLLTTIAVLMLAANVYSQIGFLRPVPNDLFEMDITTDRDITSDYVALKWMARPMFTITATQFMLTDPVTVKLLSSLGTGISLARFIPQNGEPYMDFAVNLGILFSEQTTGIEPAKLSVAASVSLWQYINFGIGRSFEAKKFFILWGINYNFN